MLWAVLAFLAPVFAQTDSDTAAPAVDTVATDSSSAGVTYLDRLIVSATRQESILGNSPSISYVVGREDVDVVDAQQVSDALQYVTGVNIEGGTGSGGANKRNIAINGMPSYYNVVMLNGMRLRSSHIQTGTDVNQIPAGAVERIEIIKDASSALYGSDALGGVVNIVTPRGGAKPTATIGGSFGSNNSWKGEVSSTGTSASGKASYGIFCRA
jgi:outer membrane cobalamin receptor